MLGTAASPVTVLVWETAVLRSHGAAEVKEALLDGHAGWEVGEGELPAGQKPRCVED